MPMHTDYFYAPPNVDSHLWKNIRGSIGLVYEHTGWMNIVPVILFHLFIVSGYG